MPLLIATDEAGYGPRLGPLVIVATAWRLPPDVPLQAAHQQLAKPLVIDSVGELRIDDSKRLFVRKSASRSRPPNISVIDLLTDAAAAWAALPLPSENYRQWLLQVAAHDLHDLGGQPWFTPLADPGPVSTLSPHPTPHTPPSAGASISQSLIVHWSSGSMRLVAIAARILDAAKFNRLLDVFANKADLLSHTTCALALKLWQRHREATDPQTLIYSDRHGGRAYYGGLLQHHCPELNMRVISESTQCSSYRLSEAGADALPAGGPSIDWSFTVGGDSYPPVALSSIIAKSTRERLMALFNRYFQTEAAEHTIFRCAPLRPTAGYTIDATRFLEDIQPIRTRRSLADAILIRKK